ncbi:MAG: 1-acyl-sn-glycerol-3-phosphate acyltransferase, partial [Myxococcota bacterium]
VEGIENLPEEPVIFAMNHTDRFNYFPFQLVLFRRHDRFTATWVKGKYFEGRAVGLFMEKTNNLPAVSRGYIITRDLVGVLGRRPEDAEYAALRRAVDTVAAGRADAKAVDAELRGTVAASLLTVPRRILGRPFDPLHETYAEAVNGTFSRMMRRFVELHEEAFRLGLDVIIFPEGTRSRRLSRGRIGISQVALRYHKTVVPVGGNGSDRLYPGSNPFAKGGRVVYRIGEPLRYEDASAFHVPEPFVPFDARDEAKHRERFQGYVDELMHRIDGLLDPEYRFQDGESGGVRGSHRFV